MQAIEELGYFQLPGIVCTGPCDMGQCIIVLKHEVMVVDEWQTMGLRISSQYLCAFKLPLIKCNCVCCL
jgi:hypothetical protein